MLPRPPIATVFASDDAVARSKGIGHFREALVAARPFTAARCMAKAMRVLLRRSGEQPEYVGLLDELIGAELIRR